jgi:formyltetrahydrofolate synthetase
MDINDRFLRKIEIGQSETEKGMTSKFLIKIYKKQSSTRKTN